MQFRREPDLGIDNPVGGQVFGALGGDPDQRIPGLHHGHCVLECLQVQLELAARRGTRYPLGQASRTAGWQPPVPLLAGQLDDGLRAEPAIKVIVQQHLRSAADLLDRQ